MSADKTAYVRVYRLIFSIPTIFAQTKQKRTSRKERININDSQDWNENLAANRSQKCKLPHYVR
jgi:hypothetical protein